MKTTPYSLFSIQFWLAYGVHMRPYLLYVSGIAGLMGCTLVDEVDPMIFALSTIPFFLGYGFGQALTDSFQTDTDKISSPYRPLSREVITTKQVFWVSLVGLCLIAVILVYLSWSNLLLCLLTILGLGTYSFVKKHWPFGPFHNSWIVMILPIMGFLSMKGSYETLYTDHRLWYALLITFFSYCNFVLIGYLKDIEADRATGYITFPVKFGWNATVWMGNLNALIFLTLGFLYINDFNTIGFGILILTVLVTVIGQLSAHLVKEQTPETSKLAIANTVRSFIMIHMAIMLFEHLEYWPFCLVFYLLFEITLYFRPEKTQI